MDFSLPPIVLFDMDGVQVLSEHVHEQRWIALASSLDVRMTKEDFDRNHRFPIPDEQGGWREVNRPLRGAHEDVICHWILHKRKQKGHKTSPSLKEMRIRLFDLYKAKSENLVPRRNLPELIHDIADRGFLLGTVTGCHRASAEINNKGPVTVLRRLMSFIITADDDTTKHKPDPSPYYLLGKSARPLAGSFGPSSDGSLERPCEANRHYRRQSKRRTRSAQRLGRRAGIQNLLPGQKPLRYRACRFDQRAIVQSAARHRHQAAYKPHLTRPSAPLDPIKRACFPAGKKGSNS